MNDISRKWEKWFHTYFTLIAYILYNDQWILLIFETKVKKTTTFCSTNGYCQILVTFWATWRQNFDNFFLGHTVYVLPVPGYQNWVAQALPCIHSFKRIVCIVGWCVNREDFNFKLAMVTTCSTWPLLNKYAL